MKSYVKFGLFAAIGSIFWTLISYVTGMERMDSYRYFGFLSVIIPIVCIYFGIKEKKDNELSGFITYGRAFNQGLLITLVNTTVFTFFSFFYYKYINPGIIDFQMQKALIKMQEKGMDDAQVEKSIGMIQMWMNPTFFTITSFFMFLFTGVVISLIIAAILKNPNPDEIS